MPLKKLFIFSGFLFISQASLAAGTMMQAFYWDVPNGLWKTLTSEVDEIKKSGITAIWIPPAYKGNSGGYSMGYDAYDLYDFGEYDQKGTVATKFGTKEELETLIKTYHDHNIQIYEDVVLNHLTGGNPERVNGNTYWTSFLYPHWRWTRAFWDFDLDHNEEKEGIPSFCYSWGYKVNYYNGYNYDQMLKWSEYLDQTYHFDGYRFDAGMCLQTWILKDFMGHGNNGGKFAVAEVWDTNLNTLKDYVHQYEGRIHLFDFNLYYTLRDMAVSNGFFDMRRLVNAGLVGVEPRYAVTFAENHDTDRSSPIYKNKQLVYAYIMTHDGYPTVFYKDWQVYGMKDEISFLANFHHEHARGPSKVWYADADLYAMARDDFILVMNDNEATAKDIGNIKTPFANKTLVNPKTGTAVKTDRNGYVIDYKLWADKSNYALWVVQ
jgi:alpha-amylase